MNLSPWIHEKYIYRQSSVYRTQADSNQESLTTGKEYTDPSMAGLDERKKKEEKSK